MVRILAFAGILIAATIALSGCATLSKQQCQTGDWRAIGVADGAAGRPLGYVRYHNEACAEFGISVDTDVYREGRKAGLKRYCTLDNAEKEGRNGRPYRNVCSGPIGDGFVVVYRAAHDIYRLRLRIEAGRSRIDSLIGQLNNPKLTKDQKAAIMARIRDARSEIDSLLDDLRLDEHWLQRTRLSEARKLDAA